MTPSRTITVANAEAPKRLGAEQLTGCPWHDVKAMLRDVGLRPTRQRMALGWILFAKGDRHITAEMLYEEAAKAKVPVAVCGEMAGDPQLTRLLLGMGLRNFSMHPAHLLSIQQRVLTSEAAPARTFAERMRRTDDPARLVALLDKLNA